MRNAKILYKMCVHRLNERVRDESGSIYVCNLGRRDRISPLRRKGGGEDIREAVWRESDVTHQPLQTEPSLRGENQPCEDDSEPDQLRLDRVLRSGLVLHTKSDRAHRGVDTLVSRRSCD